MVQTFVSICHHGQKKVYLGTILPATGYASFDSSPVKEVLRKQFNAWIRQGGGADGVIDFDAAMADPAKPSKLRADWQSDWIHPNDIGYQRMAEVAARVVGGK
jgi:hypothetical protein